MFSRTTETSHIRRESPGIFILLNCCVSGQEAQLLHFNASACVHGGVKTFDTSAGIALMFFFTALQAHTNITSLLRRTNLLHCWSNTLNHQQGQSLSAGKSAKVCSLKNSPSFISPQNTPPSVKDSCSHREQPHKRGPIGFNTLVDLYSRESGCCLSVPPLLLCLDLPRSQGCPCVLLSRTQKHTRKFAKCLVPYQRRKAALFAQTVSCSNFRCERLVFRPCEGDFSHC